MVTIQNVSVTFLRVTFYVLVCFSCLLIYLFLLNGA